MISKRVKRASIREQKKVRFAAIPLVILLLCGCFIVNAFAETSIMAGVGKISPLLKKEISQKQQNQLLENKGITESQEPAKYGPLMKIIVVMDANYLEPLPAALLQELRERVEQLGGRVGNHAFNNVQVWLSLGKKVEELAAWPAIKLIKKPTKPIIHDVMSDSLRDFGVGDWQAGGITGKEVNVGIIDAGFSGYVALLGSALPTQVKIQTNGSTFLSSKHGTACAEIVHALAPDAALFLVNVDDIEVDFFNAVHWLQAKGVKVISSSIGLNLKIFCQQAYEVIWGDYASSLDAGDIIDYIDQVEQQWNSIISNAVAHGVVWSQAAGNDARKKWSGPFIDTEPDGNLNFSALDNRNKIDVNGYVDEAVYVLLLWGGVSGNYNDYDLYIVNQNWSVIEKSYLDQEDLPIGIEVCKFKAQPGEEYYIAVNKYPYSVFYDHPDNLVLLIGHEQFPKLQYSDPSGTVTLNCPASNPDVITVGAVSLTSSSSVAVIENYSSQGPAGDLLKPDLVAPDSLNTASYTRFYGTSAAAPYVAGVCALVKQRYPDFTPVEVKQYLESNALDLGTAGKDNVYGSGLVQLPVDFACRESNPAGCVTSSSCNVVDAFWYGGICSLTPRREVRDYNETIAAAPVRMGSDVADGEISKGEGLSLEVDFPLPEETTNYALLSLSGDAYFIRNDSQGNFLTKDFTSVSNATFFETTDLCALLPGYQGTWEIYFLSVPAGADDFQTLEALSDYLESDAGQYVFGQYSVEINCR